MNSYFPNDNLIDKEPKNKNSGKGWTGKKRERKGLTIKDKQWGESCG